MKNLLFLLILSFILSSCASQGYSPAFEADHVFKNDTEKYTYMSNKYKLPPYYHIACDEDTVIAEN